MKRKSVLTVLLLGTMLLLTLLFGCTACDDNKNNKNVIRLSEVTHSIFYAPQYLAMSLGLFEEAGIELELSNGGGADKCMTALLTNEADVALMGPEAVIYVYLEGKKDYPQVFGQLTKRDGSFLVGRYDDPDFDYSDLTGKHILMGRKGGVPAMTLQYILNGYGYYDGVNITMDYSVQFDLLGPAFIEGTGDFVPLFEPTATLLCNEGHGFIVNSIGKESGEVPYTCYAASQSYIKENPELLEKFLRCIYEATQYLLTHSAEEVAPVIMEHFDGVPESDIVLALKAYAANDTWVTSPVMKQSSFERLQDIMENAGELSSRTPFTEIVYNVIASKVAPIL